MFKLKEQNKICRKYSQDIWGNIIKKKKINKVSYYLIQIRQEKWLRYKPFFLDINSRKPLKRRKIKSRFAKNLDILKKLSFFCGGLRRKKLNQILTIAAKQASNNFIENFFYLIELRLVLIVYRMNYCATILEAMHDIYAGYILVNKKVIKQINYFVQIGDIIEIISFKRQEYFQKYWKNQKNTAIFIVQLHFSYINYGLGYCMIIGNLHSGLMKYPFKMSKQYSYMLQKSKI